MSPVDPVQRQLDAYNAHDLDAFIANYADDVRLYRLPSAEPSIVGKAALAEHYAKNRFTIPSLRATLVNRMAFGNKVVDHEVIVGLGPEPLEAAVVYEVRDDGLIAAMWMIRAR